MQSKISSLARLLSASSIVAAATLGVLTSGPTAHAAGGPPCAFGVRANLAVFTEGGITTTAYFHLVNVDGNGAGTVTLPVTNGYANYTPPYYLDRKSVV